MNEIEKDTSYRSRALSEYSGLLAQEDSNALQAQHQQYSSLRHLEASIPESNHHSPSVPSVPEIEQPSGTEKSSGGFCQVFFNDVEYVVPMQTELCFSSALCSADNRVSTSTARSGATRTFIVSAQSAEDGRTTLMMRDIPNAHSSTSLEQLFNLHGFQSRYDFLYLPIDFRTGASLGYAFINFVSPGDAQLFKMYFEGFSRWGVASPKVCHVTWTDPNQGLQNHVQTYRNSPVMHESVPDEFKPRMYNNGVRIAFPEPTKRIKKPRIRPAKAESLRNFGKRGE